MTAAGRVLPLTWSSRTSACDSLRSLASRPANDRLAEAAIRGRCENGRSRPLTDIAGAFFYYLIRRSRNQYLSRSACAILIDAYTPQRGAQLNPVERFEAHNSGKALRLVTQVHHRNRKCGRCRPFGDDVWCLPSTGTRTESQSGTGNLLSQALLGLYRCQELWIEQKQRTRCLIDRPTSKTGFLCSVKTHVLGTWS